MGNFGQQQPGNPLAQLLAAMGQQGGMRPDAASWATNPADGPSMEGQILQALFATIPGMIPGVGEAMDARDFNESRKAGSKLGMGLAAASAALPLVSLHGARRALPDVGANRARDLGEFGDAVYRETDIEGLMDFVGGTSRDMTWDDVYFATSPDLALGQGKNVGVLIEVDPKGLRGQVNTSKPGWDMIYGQGDAELLARLNRQGQYREAVRSVVIRPDAVADKVTSMRLKRIVIPSLVDEGWVKSVLDDGSIRLERPR